MKNKILSCLTVLLVISCFSSCKKKDLSAETSSNESNVKAQIESSEINIGAVLSLTGSMASFGQSGKNGIELALEQINSQGGFNGKKYKLIALDDQSRPDEAATVTTRLVTEDNVAAILGEVTSSTSLAMAPIAQAAKVPMISPTATNPRVTQVGDYIFRVCFIDPFQGTVMAKFAKNSLNETRVAILRDIKNDYSMGLADYFTKTFTALGGTIVTDQSYSAGDVDFTSQITSIKAQNPEAIFVPGYYTEVGLIARQAKAQGLNVPLLGGDGWDSSKLVEIGGTAIDGGYFSNHYSPDDPNPLSQKFLKSFTQKYNKTPDGFAVMGYDAMMVLHDAITRAKSIDREQIRNAVAQTKDYAGASGTLSINESRDAVKPAVVLQVQKGHFAFNQKVNP